MMVLFNSRNTSLERYWWSGELVGLGGLDSEVVRVEPPILDQFSMPNLE
jgi:hypothetical protein